MGGVLLWPLQLGLRYGRACRAKGQHVKTPLFSQGRAGAAAEWDGPGRGVDDGRGEGHRH